MIEHLQIAYSNCIFSSISSFSRGFDLAVQVVIKGAELQTLPTYELGSRLMTFCKG